MFENKFNSKKADPLVEAAKAAMELGQKRRDAIAAVNEEFGVFNRNAVVRENLAAYDARIEQVFNGMKSGNLTESNKENKEKKKEHEEKTGLEHIKKMGGFPGQSLKRTARSLTKEELSPKQKKMASLAGNPNKIDAADLASLRKGAKIDEKKGCYEEGNDGNLANNYPPYDKVTRGDVIAGRLGKDQMGGKKKVDEKKMWEGSPMDSDVVGGGAVTKDSKPVVSQTAPKADTSGPSAADKAGLAAKIGAMKEAKLNEAVSRKHFQQVADLIKGHESQEKRNELASHHASIFAKQNPRFDHGRFHKAAGSTAHEAPSNVKESVLAAVRAKYMKEEQGF